MGNYIDKIHDIENDVDAQIKHSYLNEKGNMEVSNEELPDAPADSKVNIVSKTDIQVKPGDDSAIQLDCEKNTEAGDPVELVVKVCNGGYDKSNRVVGGKVNVAEVTIDNQKAHTQQIDSEDVFDIDKLRINFRTDKWKTKEGNIETPTRRGGKGPVEVKLRGKSFDIRCHGTAPGGGIALQPSGTDNDGHENKIKFESSRKSPLGAQNPEYDTEGGMGMEFGTFNNEHTSLFTEDYRFNKDGMVYAVTREAPEVESSGKVDYPTQEDDFKDVLDMSLAVKWETIVKTAKVFEMLSDIQEPAVEDLMDAFNEVFHPQTTEP